MNPFNMFSTCSACNFGEDGKGTKKLTPITTPFNESIGYNLDFELNTNVEIIEIDSDVVPYQNYIKLLQLKERYEDKQIFRSVSRKIQIINDLYSDLELRYGHFTCESSIKETLDNHVKRTEKQETFTIVVRKLLFH